MISARSIGRRFAAPVLAALCVAVLASAPGWPAVRGMVTRIQREQIAVNLGIQKSVRPGMLLYVYDALQHPVATVKVVQVDDYSSNVEIVSLEPHASLNVGNTVTDASYVPTPPGAAATAPPPHDAGTPGRASPPPKAVDPVKDFEKALKDHTQMYSFRGGKGGTVKIDTNDVLNIMTTIGGMAGRGQVAIMNPWLISSTAYDYYERYNTSARMNQKAKSTLEVVYWDEALTNSYANYYTYKETFLDANKKEEVRQSLLAQKGVQTSAVFQVRIRNRGPGTLQLAPFDWHAYLLDPDGNRVKAERYDEILDKAMNPGQEVQGYVYFPRRDPLGRSYVGDPVQLMIEDVFGERTIVRWDFRKRNTD